MKNMMTGEWCVGGVMALIFGLWMLFHPLVGGLALLWIIGIYAAVVGVIMIIQAFRLRRLGALPV